MRPKFIRLWVRGTHCSSQCASSAFPAVLLYPRGCCLGPIISYESIDSCSVVSTTELLWPQDSPASLPKHRVLVAEGLLDLRSRISAGPYCYGRYNSGFDVPIRISAHPNFILHLILRHSSEAPDSWLGKPLFLWTTTYRLQRSTLSGILLTCVISNTLTLLYCLNWKILR